MENIIFNYNHAKTLIDTEKLDEVKAYIKLFFFRFQDKIFYFDGEIFNLMKRVDALLLIPSDFAITRMVANQHTHKFEKVEFTLKNFLRETEFMAIEYKPTIDFSQPRLFTKTKLSNGFEFTNHFINMSKNLNTNLTSIQPNRTIKIEEGLKCVYNHIFEVLCSKNELLYEYVLNFFCASIGGRKVRKALIFQSAERTGKGLILNGLLNSILGQRMFKCNSIENIVKYSKPFEGCCLLNFDELPHCDNYKGVQDMLKGLITEPTFICRNMYELGYECQNTFNIIISSNNDSINLSLNNNSRYVVLDISEHRIGDTEYFKQVTKALNTDDVKRSFYQDMLERFKTLDKWNEDIMPETLSRDTKIIEALPMFYKYVKEQYILTETDLNVKTDEFFMEYRLHTKDKTSTQKLGRYIKAIEITPIKLSKNAGYKYQKSSKELYDIFKAKKWIDEEVDLINPENPNKKPSDEEDNFKSKYENLLKQHEELKKQLQQLQEPKATKQPKNVVINEIKESKETSINSLLSITNDADAMDEMINAML
jgi:hypothetical protein